MSQAGNGQGSDIPPEFQERVAKAKAEAKATQEAWLVAEQRAEIARQQERDKVIRMGRWAAQMLKEARVPYDALLPIETTLTQRIVLLWKDPMYRRNWKMRGWQLMRPTNLAASDARYSTMYDVILEPDGAVVHRINGQEWPEQTERLGVRDYKEYRRHSNQRIEEALIELLAQKT